MFKPIFTIWKYEVFNTYEQSISLPGGSELLAFQLASDGRFYIWAKVNQSAPVKIRKIHIRGTGDYLGDAAGNARYIGTVIEKNNLVWHLFEGEEV